MDNTENDALNHSFQIIVMAVQSLYRPNCHNYNLYESIFTCQGIVIQL